MLIPSLLYCILAASGPLAAAQNATGTPGAQLVAQLETLGFLYQDRLFDILALAAPGPSAATQSAPGAIVTGLQEAGRVAGAGPTPPAEPLPVPEQQALLGAQRDVLLEFKRVADALGRGANYFIAYRSELRSFLENTRLGFQTFRERAAVFAPDVFPPLGPITQSAVAGIDRALTAYSD